MQQADLLCRLLPDHLNQLSQTQFDPVQRLCPLVCCQVDSVACAALYSQEMEKRYQKRILYISLPLF